ncbi:MULTISPECIES: flagellar hook-associated protein FlgK [unclassified Agarivorans]|uniref:flagellar hook-associated protein FlgK n=1 Tax=unclassified Agarivorans TaxID=2636026 RepID=UPI0026E13ECB|nr:MULTISPECIES: flagellar hook-associated protein FlgK [unclassified Agarivorans]MDO6684696.1 flagellar hook-associated protein FlgK [Agarivorans sp. 3_MG-2023]MDO6715143.1 flagellar hook-associated protein FlgK [Agarivorans sp. 2_MG-2023]
MAMNDLLTIGSSGVAAHQRLLMTTGNNIANVNTPGYSLQRTFYTADTLGGVREGYTERVLNGFAQAQMFRDTSTLANRDAYLESVSNIDAILSDDSLSLSSKFDDTFTQLHATTDNPTALSTRELALSQFNALTDRYRTLNEQYSVQEKNLSQDIVEKADEANALIRNIAEINKEIVAAGGSPLDGNTAILGDKRDQAIKELAELIDINTIVQDDGSTLVFMRSGQALVLQDDHTKLAIVDGDPDSTQKEMTLSLAGSTRIIGRDDIGATIGGLMEYRKTTLDTSRNQLGQLSVAMTDAFNTQNRLGMDLNGDIGGDIFTLPTFNGKEFSTNTTAGTISGSFIAGSGSEVTPYDYRVTFTSPTTFEMQRFDGDSPIETAISGTIPPTNFQLDGIDWDFSSGPFAAGDKHLIQPVRDAAAQMTVSMSQPEKLALASPIRVERELNNRGNATVSIDSIYDTDPATSNFTAPGGYDPNGPHEVRINNAGDYEIYNGVGALMATAPAASAGQQLFANAVPALTPGYEINIDGDVQEGDVFTMDYNTDGFNDNYNALRLVDLQQKDLVRKSLATGGDNKMTMNDAYASVVSFVGGKTSEARVAVSAATSLLEQSTQRHNSISGVNLDEEASNLIRFQQAYAASAQVISAAQETFQTLLSSVR